MCWEWVASLDMYKVDFMEISCLKNLVWSVSLNIFIVIGYARHKFRVVGVIILCYQNPSNLFPFLSIQRAW